MVHFIFSLRKLKALFQMNNKEEYQKYIDSLPDDVQSQCAKITEQMQYRFPELNRVRGHVLLTNGWERDH
jgi:hypothetical protein